MQKIIVGLTGEIASGKDTASRYIVEKHKAHLVRFSQSLRDMLDRMFLEQNRENMSALSLHIRQAFGEDILSKVVLKESEISDRSMIIVDGIRRVSDIVHLKVQHHFYFIYVDASQETRYQRLIGRRQNTDDATKTLAQFKQDALLETELEIATLRERADFIINNNGTHEELKVQIDEVIARILTQNID
ncbi:MAG: AAA family ATPase [Minisyncoccota bacterium]